MYFVANWKMYGNLSSLNTLDKVIKFSKSKEIKKGRLIYCPPFTLISSFSKKFRNCQIGIGGQNCHESENYGAYTGFVNSRMLKNIGAHFVIIGHSENREKGENDQLINLLLSPISLFSEWPIITKLAPIFFNIRELTKPVCAPKFFPS